MYGDRPEEVVDESTPVNSHPLIQWRIDHEKAVVGQDKINGVVIRPSFVYGYSGSYSSNLFNITGDTLVIRGTHTHHRTRTRTRHRTRTR